MNQPDSVTRTVLLNALPRQVWKTITTPEGTKLFMFNCEAHSDWTVDSEILWKGNFNGYESGERGIILDLREHQFLKYTSIDPNFGIEDKPENYLHISYALKAHGSHTELTTSIESFNGDPDRISHIATGWDNIVLPALKQVFSSAAY